MFNLRGKTMFNLRGKFSRRQWGEIEALSFGPFFPTHQMTRSEWMAVATMAIGKAERISSGEYGGSDDELNVEAWADELQGIASIICGVFKPGDGQVDGYHGDRQHTVTLNGAQLGIIRDALESRAHAYETTAEVLDTDYNPDDIVIEEVSDSDEARRIAEGFRDALRAIATT